MLSTLIEFVQFALGFVPMLIAVAILLVLFWAATKLFPSLNEWMSNADDMADAVEPDYRTETRHAFTTTYDRYV
jgi:hypothetical protein